MLNALFDARHLRSGLIEAGLNQVQRLGLGCLIGTHPLDLRFNLAQVRDFGLHGSVAARHRGIANQSLQIERLQAQRQKLGQQPSLLFLERLIASRSGRLPLQMFDLLLDLFAQVIQPIEVFPCMADAALRLAAAFLVAGNAGRLLQERAQIVRPRFDHARNHSLFDDGVAARTETRAQKQLRDVLAAHLGPVDEVIRGTIATHRSAQRHLVVAGVSAADLAVGIVEHQFNRRRAQRFARGRAVENDVGHRFAAQVLCRNLAHHPADRVDDVGFAATVGAHDAGQAARKAHRGRVYEGLEAGNLELGQPHYVRSLACKRSGRRWVTSTNTSVIHPVGA